MIKAILLKPLDGQAIGDIVEYSQADFDYLKGMNAVDAATKGSLITEIEVKSVDDIKIKKRK